MSRRRDPLEASRKAAERERYRKRQAERRAAEKRARSERKRKLELARQLCKENAKHARDVAEQNYKRDRERAIERRRETKRSASVGCKGSKSQIRDQAKRSIEASARARAEEKRIRDELRRTEAHARKLNRSRATPAQRRSEADDAVTVNIAPEDRALWNRVKGSIRATDRKSRTEAFQQYVEENPGEAIRARESAAERQWKREVAARYREEARERRRA